MQGKEDMRIASSDHQSHVLCDNWLHTGVIVQVDLAGANLKTTPNTACGH
jgi:hypothetical protein